MDPAHRLERGEEPPAFRGRRERLALRVADERGPGDAAPSPETAAVELERRKDLLAALERLPSAIGWSSRTATCSSSEAETATALGVRPGTVKSRRLARARRCAGSSPEGTSMAEEHRMSDERLAASLAALGRELAYPPTPALDGGHGPHRAPRHRPAVLPGRALWSRRRVLVLVAVGCSPRSRSRRPRRFAIGAFEIRVQPGRRRPPPQPPVQPDVLGDPVSPPEEAAAAAGSNRAARGPVPDEAYVVDSLFGDPGLYVWRPSDRYPRSRAEWGLVLMAFQGDSETVIKSVEAFENVRRTADGRPAFWVTPARRRDRDRPRDGDLRGPRQRARLAGRGRPVLPDGDRPGPDRRRRPRRVVPLSASGTRLPPAV